MKKYQIVLVENDDDERLFMKKGIEQTGLFEIVAQAENGQLLLDWLQENQTQLPDLILSDLNMPVTNGYEVLEALQDKAYGHLPVVITSTSSAPTIIAKCLSLGAADYLIKPDTFLEYDVYGKELYQRIEQKGLIKDN